MLAIQWLTGLRTAGPRAFEPSLGNCVRVPQSRGTSYKLDKSISKDQKFTKKNILMKTKKD